MGEVIQMFERSKGGETTKEIEEWKERILGGGVLRPEEHKGVEKSWITRVNELLCL
jgi:hypothetical protein